MIIPTRWKDVKVDARVIDPSGQMFHVKPRVVDFLVQVADRHGNVHTIPIDPNAYVPVLFEMYDIAVTNLSKHFALDYRGEK